MIQKLLYRQLKISRNQRMSTSPSCKLTFRSLSTELRKLTYVLRKVDFTKDLVNSIDVIVEIKTIDFA